MQIRDLVLAELNPPFRPTLVTDLSGLESVRAFLNRVPDFGLDTETNVVKRFTERKCRVIQIGNRQEQYVIDLLAFAGSTAALMEQGWKRAPRWAGPVVDAIRPALESKEFLKLGVNLQFDYEVLLWCLGIRAWNFYDCLMAEKLIYAGRVDFFAKNFWGAEKMFERYTGLRLPAEFESLGVTFDLENQLTPDQVAYAGFDVRLPYPIRGGQQGLIRKYKLERAAEVVEFPAIPAFGSMKVTGINMDPACWKGLMEKNEEQHAANVQALDSFFIPVVGNKHTDLHRSTVKMEVSEKLWREASLKPEGLTLTKWRKTGRSDDEWETRVAELKAEKAAYRQDYYAARKVCTKLKNEWDKYEGEAAINYGSQQQLLDAIYQITGLGPAKLPSTNDKVLSTLAKDYPVIKALQDYRETLQRKKNFGENFIEHINPVTGRIHSNINQLGAATGRTTSSDPNIQNIPGRGEGAIYRTCFVAPPGRKIVTVDMAGAELRILAELSGEPVWVTAFQNGWDAHSMGAELMYGERWAKAADIKCGCGAVIPLGDLDKHIDECAACRQDVQFAKAYTFVCKYYAHRDGQQLFEKCKCTLHKPLREGIKTANFGVAYGMEERALAEKLGISVMAARALLALWREKHAVVYAYLVKSGEDVRMQLTAHSMSGRHRLFHQPTWDRAREIAMKRLEKDGRDPALVGQKDISRAFYSLFSSIEREGKNMPIQGTNADIAKVAMGAGFDDNGKPFMWHLLPLYDAELVNFVHDEFVVECPEEHAQAVYDMVGDCIVRAAAVFMKKVRMEYEGAIADRWSK